MCPMYFICRLTMMSLKYCLQNIYFSRQTSSADLSQLFNSRSDVTSTSLPVFSVDKHDTYLSLCIEKLQEMLQVKMRSNSRNLATITKYEKKELIYVVMFKVFNSAIEGAPVHFLLGVLHFAGSQQAEAMREFQRLQSCDERLIPARFYLNF